MADTPLSSQMESEYKVAKWNRSTVADGSWLQKYTIEKLKDRDIFLANHIDSATGDLTSALEAEIAARKEGDNYISATLVSVSGDLVNVSSDFYDFSAKVENSASVINNTINVFSAKVEQSASDLKDSISAEETRAKEVENNLAKEIDKIKGATDVIAVFGTYDEFSAASASEWQQTVTDNDFIKVLRDDTYQPTGDEDEGTHDDDYYQVYYEWHDNNGEHGDWTGWSAIGNLDPYYSVAETDEIISDLSATITANYYSAKNVKAGNNISAKYSTNGAPTVTLGLSSTILLDGVSSTNLSSQFVTAVNLSSNNVSATNLSATTISAATASGQSAIFTGISAQGLTATNVYSNYVSSISGKTDYLTAWSALGDRASYMSGYFTKLGGVDVTAGDLIATQAKISGLSALNISGNGKSSTVSGLILSSQSGAWASAVLNSAYWSATNGTNGNSGLIGDSFVISAGANLGLSVDGSAIKISGTPAGVTSISAKDTNVNTNFTGGTVTLSAGPNIDFVTVDTNTLGIKLEDSIYWSAGVYNDYTSFSADFSSLQIKHTSQYNGTAYISFSGDKLNLCTANVSQSQGTISATLDSNGVCAYDSQAGSTPYHSTWIDIISGTNLQNGNYVYIDRTANTVNLSSNISATNISAETISGHDISAVYYKYIPSIIGGTTAWLSSDAYCITAQTGAGGHGNTYTATWTNIAINNETRNGTMAKMNSGDYISSNRTITAIVSASTIGTDSQVLYLV